MNREKSCGAIVFTRRNGQLLYAVVQEASGAFSFPKGHTEGGETEPETARREILEETGLHPDFLEASGKRMNTICGKSPARGSRWFISWLNSGMRRRFPVPGKSCKSGCCPMTRRSGALSMPGPAACLPRPTFSLPGGRQQRKAFRKLTDRLCASDIDNKGKIPYNVGSVGRSAMFAARSGRKPENNATQKETRALCSATSAEKSKPLRRSSAGSESSFLFFPE